MQKYQNRALLEEESQIDDFSFNYLDTHNILNNSNLIYSMHSFLEEQTVTTPKEDYDNQVTEADLKVEKEIEKKNEEKKEEEKKEEEKKAMIQYGLDKN